MNDKEFSDKFFQILNTFRQHPTSITQKMETFKLGLSRLKSRQNSEFAKLIDKLAVELQTMSTSDEFELNDDLCECCENHLKKMDPDKPYLKFMMNGKNVKKHIPEAYENEDCVLFFDDGVDDPEIFLIKILINKDDKSKIGKNLLQDNEYTQVGVAYQPTDEEEGNVVAIFAKNKPEPEPEPEQEPESKQMELPEGDLSELKQAFDLFDVQEVGRINPKDTVEAMKAINFNEKNPQLFTIMEDLQEVGDSVDFPTFAWHIVSRITDKKSKDGLKTIFNLYVDDFDDETISLGALKKICRRLKERQAEKEVDMLMSGSSSNMRLNFEEFFEFMEGKYMGKQ